MPLSIIIPIGKSDSSWKSLLPDLRTLNKDDEIILAAAECLEHQIKTELSQNNIQSPIHCIETDSGRAKQLNAGAKIAKNDILLFLHCDSKISQKSIEKIKLIDWSKSETLYFFNLKFLNDGPFLTNINQFGVYIRSNILKLPFGDQGFCLHRNTFQKLGPFNEEAAYGEDHLLIWKAHRQGIKIKSIGAPLYTSARKYASNGWAQTTKKHLYLTFKQALPELKKIFTERLNR